MNRNYNNYIFVFFQKLQEKQNIYKEKGTDILICEDPFAVAIVSPIMARSHASQFSNDICFVDSTSACDAEQHSITFIMAPCAAGAVPLGIIITRGQTYEAYCKGFQLLQEIVNNSFHPKYILTDNSDAEISALNTVFPNSVTLLCIFHVLQAVWRWLWDSKHCIPKEDRKEMMEYFRKVLYSRTEIDAIQAFSSNSFTKYENWVKYLEIYWNIKEKWCLAWRNEDSRGHYTNNFCEASIRLFKDNILCRVKAYNVIALIDVISVVLEEFYRRKLREFANSRSSNVRVYFLNMIQKTSYLKKSDIICISELYFKVPSEKVKNEFYLVSVEQGCCSCLQGIAGKFCKHQCAIYKYFDIKTKSFPPITSLDKYNIAKLALGDKTPEMSFYAPFLAEDANLHSVSYLNAELDLDNKENRQCNNTDYQIESLNCSISHEVPTNKSDSVVVSEICDMIKTCHASFGSSASGLNILKQRLMTIKTEGQWETFIHCAGSSQSLRKRRNASIKVQPTAISRRAPGVTRGSKRLPAGRRFKDEKIKKKRQRNLSLNVKLNQPNAISHGFNH